jgi:ABC-type glycerol-3-phosphate transport system substrate-binding protein
MGNKSNQKQTLSCQQVEAQLMAYLKGGLAPARRRALREHLVTCDACAQGVREIEDLEAELYATASRHQPRLAPRSAARIQDKVYRRMRRGLIVQRTTQFTARLVGVMAVLVLVVGLFALWGQGMLGTEETADQALNPDEVTVITFACMDYERSHYEGLAQDFNTDNPDVRVQFISAEEASGWQRQGSVVTISGSEFEQLASAADTFAWFASLQPGDWTFLLDLGPFVDDPSFPSDDFYPGVLDHFRWQGGIYGLPSYVNLFMIFYDKKMFDEAGLPYPSVGWTWDDLIKAATRLTQREGDTVTRYGFVDNFFDETVQAMLRQYDVPLWDEGTIPPQPLLNTPAVADVMRRYVDMALGDEIMPLPEIGSNLMASTLINEGKAAIWTDFSLGHDDLARRTDLGLAPYPEAVRVANPHSLNGFFASAGTAHPDAAWRWLAYLSANYAHPIAGALPGRRSVTEGLSWWQALDEAHEAILEYALAHPLLPDHTLDTPLLVALADVFEDGVSVEKALEAAQAKALALQSQLAEVEPSSPRPVATPQPMPAEGQTVITFAPYLTLNADLSSFEKLAASFNASHPGIWVQIVSPPYPYSLAEQAMSADCFGGKHAVQSPGVRQFVRNLQPFLDAETDFDLADYYAAPLDWSRHDGELWALPYEMDALMVYINLDRFAEAGLAPPEPGWRFEDFVDLAVALSDAGRYGFTTREGAYGDLLFFLDRMGVRLYDDSQERPTPTLDDPTVVAALARYAELSRAQALTPATPSTQSGWPDTTTAGSHPAQVESGQVAMWVDALSSYAFAPPLPFETGAAPLPVGVQASTEFDVSAYYISAHTSEPQACWEWLRFLSDQPEAVGLLPVRRSVLPPPELWQGRVSASAWLAYQATLEYTHTSLFDLRWESPWLAYTYPWLDAAFQAVVGGEDAAGALREAQDKAQALVACLEAVEGFSDHEQLRACARQVDPGYPLD